MNTFLGLFVVLLAMVLFAMLIRGANRHRTPPPLPVDPSRAPEATPEQVGRASYAEWIRRLRKERGLLGGTEPGAESGGGFYGHGGDGGDGGE